MHDQDMPTHCVQIIDSPQPPRKVLFLAPFHAAAGGAKTTVDVFTRHLDSSPNYVLLPVDTFPNSPKHRHKNFPVTWESLGRAATVMRCFLRTIHQADVVLAYTNNYFTFFVIPWLLLIAKLRRKPFFLKPVGGSLDLDLRQLHAGLRFPILRTLKSLNGIIAQTQLLATGLRQLGIENVYYVPGWREPPDVTADVRHFSPNNELKIIFLSQITEAKGVRDLIAALRLIDQTDTVAVSCDFVGPIFSDLEDEFPACLDELPRARYLGTVENTDSHAILAKYDVLVLPTYLKHEGHPGVIVEAIQVGIPVISTNWRAIPELITDGLDGLLVPVNDVASLADAIRSLASNRSRRIEMAESIRGKRHLFAAEIVIPDLLRILDARC